MLRTFGPSPCEAIGNLNYIFLLILVVCFETFGPSLCDFWKLKVYFKDSVLRTFGPLLVRLLLVRTFGPSPCETNGNLYISFDVRGMLWDLLPLTLCDYLKFKLYILLDFRCIVLHDLTFIYIFILDARCMLQTFGPLCEQA